MNPSRNVNKYYCEDIDGVLLDLPNLKCEGSDESPYTPPVMDTCFINHKQLYTKLYGLCYKCRVKIRKQNDFLKCAECGETRTTWKTLGQYPSEVNPALINEMWWWKKKTICNNCVTKAHGNCYFWKCLCAPGGDNADCPKKKAKDLGYWEELRAPVLYEFE